MNNLYFVYLHRHIANHKCYIGITSNNPEQRWGTNGNNYLKKQKNNKYHQPKFARAILKYGWDAFEHIILFHSLTMIEAKQKEQELIYKYDSIKNGYNITAGGESNKRYFTEQEYLTAYKRNIAKAYQTRKIRLLLNKDLKEQARKTRHEWYEKKKQTPEYHAYILEKSRAGHAKHIASLSAEQKNNETRQHTKNVQKNRKEQAIKKKLLQKLILDYANCLASTEAQAYIASIKWYKIQSMKKLDVIEHTLHNFISKGE